ARPRLYLCHIPPVAQGPITRGVIERLLARYPGTVAGLKDSGGDWAHTLGLIETFGPEGFDVFAGSEVFLLRALVAGGAGCITAGANLNPHGIAAVHRAWRDDRDAEPAQEAADRVRRALQSAPALIPAIKAVVAHWTGDPAWRTVRPPFVEADPAVETAVLAALEEAGFAFPVEPVGPRSSS